MPMPTGFFLFSGITSALLGFGIGAIIMQSLQTLAGPYKKKRDIRSMSMDELERDLYKITIRSDFRHVGGAREFIRDLRGTPVYTNKELPFEDKEAGIVKGYIPKEMIPYAEKWLNESEYIWDVIIESPEGQKYGLKETTRVDISKYGQLLPEDRLVPRSEEVGHKTVIPTSHSYLLRSLYEESKPLAKKSKDFWEFLERMTDFVYDEIEYNLDVPGKIHHLEDMGKHGGVCKEKAALLHLLLKKFNIESTFEKGNYMEVKEDGSLKYVGGHAWVGVEKYGKKVILDPANNIMKTPEELYEEDHVVFEPASENIVERSKKV
jgi:transglutaminase-like putative cysteine protease